jgi:hypothetical protein
MDVQIHKNDNQTHDTKNTVSTLCYDSTKDSSINMKAYLGMVLFQISRQLHDINILLWFLQAASHSNLSLSVRPITDVGVELVLLPWFS